MKLGLKNNEVKIVPFDKDWKVEFSNVKNAIQSTLNIDENRILEVLQLRG